MANQSENITEEKSSAPISEWLSKNGYDNVALEKDHLGIEVIKVLSENLLSIVEALKNGKSI